MAFARERKNRGGTRHVVLGAKLGHGANGTVYSVDELDEDLHECGVKAYPSEKKHRIVKVMNANQAGVYREYTTASATPHLHAKRPRHTLLSSYLVLDFLPGEEMYKVMRAGKLNKLLPVMSVVVALLSAWKSQIDDVGLYHNDIKNDNIFLDCSHPAYPRIYFLDTGSASEQGSNERLNVIKNDKDKEKYPHLAPERLFDGIPTHKAEIFSLGALIFDILDSSLSDADFKKMVGSKSLQERLQKILDGMLDPDPSQRYDFKKANLKFHALYFMLKTQSLNKKQKDELSKGHKLALKAKGKSIAELKAILQDEHETFNVEEFIETLWQRAFYDCVTRKALLRKVDDLVSEYHSLCKRLHQLIENCDVFKKRHQYGMLFSKEGFGKAVQKQRAIYERKLQKYENKNFTSIDSLMNAVNAMQSAIDETPTTLQMLIKHRCINLNWTIRSSQIEYVNLTKAKDLRKIICLTLDVKKSDDKSLEKIKDILRAAVTEYIKNCATSENIRNSKRLASDRRVKDMTDILEIINQATNKDVLVSQLKDRLYHIRTGIFGFSSFFSYYLGSSELRDTVEGALRYAKP